MTQHQNRFLAIMDNFNRVQEVNGELMNSNGKLAEGYGKYLNSVEASAKRAEASMEKMWVDSLDSDFIKGFYDASTAITTLLGKVNILRVGLMALSSVVLLSSKRYKGFLKSLDEGGNWQRARKWINDFQLGLKDTSIEIRNTSRALRQTEGATNTFGNSIMGVGMKLTMLKIKAIAAKVGIQLLQAALTFGLSVAISFAIEGLTKLISKFASTGEESSNLAEEISGNVDGLQNNIKSLSQLSDEYDELNKKMGSSKDMTKLTAEEQDRYNDIVNQMAEIAPEIVKGYDSKGNAIVEYGTSIDELIDKEKELIELEKFKLMEGEGDAIKGADKSNKKSQKEIDKIDEDIEHYKEMIRLKQEMVENPTPTMRDEDVARHTQDLAENRQELAKLQGQRKVSMGEIEEQHGKLRQFLDFYFKDIDEFERVGETIKNTVKERVDDTLRDEGLEEAKLEVAEYTEALRLLDSVTGSMDSSYAIETFTEVRQKLMALGMEAHEAEEFLWDFKLATDAAADSQANLGEALAFSADEFKELRGDIAKLGSAYEKLSKGQELTFDEMFDLIEQNDEIAQHVAETQDMTLQNGELLVGVMKEQEDAIFAKLQAEKEHAKILMESQAEEVKQQEKKVEAMKKQKMVSKKYLDEQIENLSASKNKLKELTTEYGIFNNKIMAMNALMGDSFKENGLENAQDAFGEATSKLKAYKEILEEIEEFGSLSGETNSNILMNHEELIHLLGREGEMRKYLMKLTGEQEHKQQEMYRKALESTEAYSSQMFEQHRTLYENLAGLYDLDLNNFRTVQDLKAQIAARSANSIASTMMKLGEGGGRSEIAAAEKTIRISKIAIDHIKRGGKMNASKRAAIKEQERAIAEAELKIATAQTSSIPIPNVDFTSKKPSKVATKKPATKKKPKAPIDHIKLVTQEYLKFEKALEEVNKSLESNNRLLDLSTGADRVKLLSKEIHLLKEKQSILSKTANQYRAESKILQQRLAKDIYLGDGAMGIDSFNAKTRQMEAHINGIINQINATQDDDRRDNLTRQKDKIKKEYDEFKEDFERYIDIEFNLVPSLSADWESLQIDQFNHTLNMLEVSYEKFGRRIDTINDKMLYMLEVRQDHSKEVEEEIKLLGQIGMIYRASLQDVSRDIEANTGKLKYYESELKKISDRKSADYKMFYQLLIQARATEDKLFAIQNENLNTYANNLKDTMTAYINQMKYAKDETIKGLKEIREEVEAFSEIDLDLSIGNILAELDKLDKIFIENAKYNLSTDVAREDIESLKNSIMDTVGELEDMKKTSEDIMKQFEKVESMEVLSEKDAKLKSKRLKKLAKQLEDSTKKQIEKESELKDLRESLRIEIMETELSHKKIEDSLQNKIDIKEDELKKLQKQFEYENKIRQMLEKQLELMRALDDTRHSYITGQGEEVFTYDRDRVNQLKKEVSDAMMEEQRQAAIDKVQEEITQMKENLARTIEINKKQLEIMELERKSVDEILGILDSNIDKGFEGYNNIFDGLENVIKDKFKNMMDVVTAGLDEIMNEYLMRVVSNPYDETSSKVHGDKLNKPSQSFSSGGYTGNDEGVAMLHKKELVLNAEDTRNMLEAVKVTDSFASHLPNTQAYTKQSFNNSKGGDVILNDPVFNEIEKMSDFTNELSVLLRKGMPKLS